MANARIAHLNLDGSTDQFDVTFPYINKTHVIVKVDGSATTSFVWLTDTRIQMDSMPAAASDLIITRETSPSTRLVDYQTGSILSETILDTDSKQAFFLCQEANDVKELVLNVSDANNQWDGQSKRLTALADPTSAQDAATKNWIETTYLTSADKTNISTLAPYSSQIALLGTSDAISDMNTLGTADVVNDMNTLGTADVVSDMNTLATADIVSDMNTLATGSNVTNMNTLAGISSQITTTAGISSEITTTAGISSDITAVAGDAADIGVVAGKATEIGRLGTADAVADMAILGTTDVVADMAILATTDVVNDMNTLGTADVVSDMNTLGTADVVADMNVLATADVVSDLNTLGTADVVSDMNTLGTAANVTNMDTAATNIGNINTCATNISDIQAASSAAGLQTVDNFSGDGSETAFTMSAAPTTENNTAVYVDGIYQQKNTYSISSTTLTFSEAPPTGTNNIEVMQLSTQATGVNPTVAATNTLAPGVNATVSASGHALTFGIPRGSEWTSGTASPSGGLDGDFYFKTDDDKVFQKASGSWSEVADMTGATGPTGAAATIAVGSVTTGTAGSSVSVTNSGSSGAATFDFTIPRGDTGAAGSLSGAADGSAGAPSIAFSDDTDTGLYSPADNTIAVTTDGTERLRVDDSGVGVGVAASDTLHLYKSAADTNLRLQWDATHAGKISMREGGTETGRIEMHSPTDSVQAGNMLISTTSSGAAGKAIVFETDSTERARIDSSGRVGISQASPDTESLVDLGSGENTGYERKLNIVNTGNSRAGFGALSNIFRQYYADDQAIQFGTISRDGNFTFSEKMRLDSAGDLGIGEANPTHKLHVGGDIYATGNVTAYSSAVAKDNIETIPDALDIVEKLRGVSFDWKDSGKKSVGLIYEEVKEVIPELTSNNGGHVGVAYQNTVAVLIEAVKSLSAKVKELEENDGSDK